MRNALRFGVKTPVLTNDAASSVGESRRKRSSALLLKREIFSPAFPLPAMLLFAVCYPCSGFCDSVEVERFLFWVYVRLLQTAAKWELTLWR